MCVEGTPGVLAGPAHPHPEDVLAGPPGALAQLIHELPGVRLLGHQVQGRILQNIQGPTETRSVSLQE